jgi:hypothetical protein
VAVKIRRSTARTLLSFVGAVAALAVSPAARAQDGTTPPASGTPAAPAPTDPPKTEEEADPNAPMKKKAQPAATGATADAPNAATAGGGTVSLVTGNPPKDQATPPAAEAPKKEPKKLFWAQSQIYAMTSVNTNVFVPSQQQTAAQTVESFVLFQPRFTLDKKHFQLRGRVAFSYEWTDTASTGTTRKNEITFQDVIPSLWLRSVPVIPVLEIKPMPFIQAAIPTSQASIARTMYVAPGVGLQLVKQFEHFLGGELDLIASGVFIHPFYEQTTPKTLTPMPYQQSCFASGPDTGSGCMGQGSGLANVENQINATLIASAEWGNWSPGAFMLIANQWAYTFSKRPGVSTPQEVGAQPPTNFRQSTFFSFWLDYHFNSWLTGEVGYQMFRNILKGNGSIGNPFFDPDQDMRVYLAVNIGLDKLYQAISGEGGEGGVVRAKNTHGGTIRF